MIFRRLLLTFAISLGLLGGAAGMGGLFVTKRDFAQVPVNISAPAITGTLKVGSVLTSSFGNWTGTPTSVTYQWNRAGAFIPNEVNKTYTLTQADDLNTITVTVTAINSAGQSAPATSAATAVVTDIIPTNTTIPVISDTTPQEGQSLSVTTGTWTHNPTAYAIQWKSAGLAIAGATGFTYTVQTSDVGNALTVSVAASNSGGTSITVTSDPTSAVVGVAAVPVNTALPTISGIGQTNQVLTANVGSWSNTPTSYTYAWKRNAATTVGTAATYTATAADVGQRLTVSVIASNASGPSATAATSIIPQFGIYKTTIGGGSPILLRQTATQEMTHWRVSPNGLYAAFTTFYNFNGGPFAIETGVDYKDTELVIIRLSDGVIIGKIVHNSLYVNSNNSWMPDSSGIIYHSTQPGISNSTTKAALAKYIWGTNTSTTIYNPTDSVSDPDVRADGAIVHARFGATNGIHVYYPTGGTDTRITVPPSGTSDTDPKWNAAGTKMACSRKVGATTYRIVVVNIAASPNFTPSGELEIPAFGSSEALDGTPEWTSDGKIVFWHIDPADRAANGIYMMDADGTNRIRIPPATHIMASQPTAELGAGSGSTVPIYLSGQYIPIFPTVPTNSVAPAIANTSPLVGDIVTVTNGTWSNATSYGIQWKSSGTNSTGAGATTANYTVVAADVGKTLQATVVGKNSGGYGTATLSNATGAVTTPGAATFPGQVGNPVGYTNAPGYPGSLTAMSCGGPFTSGTSGNPTVYQFKDFDCGTGGMFLDNVHDIKFFGSRIQSNSTGNAAVSTTPTATDIVFDYVTVQPRVALVGTSPPNAAWPSSSAGLQKSATPQPNYQIPYANAYQYGFNFSTVANNTGGPYTVTNSDIWGGQNLITLYKTTATILIDNNWMHDFADELRVPRTTFTANVTGSGSSQSVAVASSAGFTSFPSGVRASGGLSNTEDLNLTAKVDGTHVTGVFTKNHISGEVINSTGGLAPTAHQDGPGYLNAGCCGPSNFTISNNTIAGLANGNLIAFQGGSFSGNNGTITGNFLSGGTVILALEGVQNTAFRNNTIGSDLPYVFGIVHSNFTTLFSGSGNTWSGNKFRVLAGTSTIPGETPQWTSGQDGFFVLPSGNLSATDF